MKLEVPMATQVEVIAMGDSLGVVLPPEVLTKLNVKDGDVL